MCKYIKMALSEAEKSLLTDDVPIGAVIVENGVVIAKGHNTREKSYKITGHAEINAIEKACKIKKTWHLSDCDLYVSLEPCDMCMEVIKQARIRHVYYAFAQEKRNSLKCVESTQIKISDDYGLILKDFFKNKRK